MADYIFDENLIALRNFWPSDDVTKEFLVKLIKDSKTRDQKVILTSVFPKTSSIFERAINYLGYRFFNFTNLKYIEKRAYGLENPIIDNVVKNIWYTGENKRIPANNDWDIFLSFDSDPSIKNNIYLPVWVTSLGENLEIVNDLIELMTQKRELKFHKTKFACAFVGNPEPTRMRFISELAKLYEIDLYGTAFKNPVKDKLSILNQYKFNICFENDLYPGYVTEKVIESWRSEAIPIWWGIDSLGYLNSSALINVYELGMEKSLDMINMLENDDLRSDNLRRNPILAKKYYLEYLTSQLRYFLS